MRTQANHKRRGQLVAAFSLAAVTVAVLQIGCRDQAAKQAPPMPVRTAEVRNIDTGTTNTYSANIQPYQQVDLSFKSNGYLVSIRQVRDDNGHIRNIDQGDYVRQGTVLATVQQDDYQQKLDQANAQLARAQADHERAALSFGHAASAWR